MKKLKELRPTIIGSTGFIPLSQNKCALVDIDDFHKVTKFNWHLLKKRKNDRSCYAGTNIKLKNGRHTILSMHNFIKPPPPGLVTDHINHNGVDCRKVNLRFCTNKQNRQNTPKIRKGSSKYKGVWWHKKRQKWVASISIDCIPKWLGQFDSQKNAALAYDEAAKKFYGEFACLNFPREVKKK